MIISFSQPTNTHPEKSNTISEQTLPKQNKLTKTEQFLQQHTEPVFSSMNCYKTGSSKKRKNKTEKNK